MNEHELMEALAALLRREAGDLPEALTEALAGLGLARETPELENVQTFRDAGVLSRDAGLVLTFDGGDEFQLTVVRSR